MAAEKRKKLHGVEGIDIVLLLLFIAYALLIIIPFYNVLVCSFTSLKEYLTTPLLLFPKQPTLKNYQDLFANGAIWIGYRTSFTILVLGVPLNLFLTTSMAYALSRRDTPGRKGIFSIILFTMLFNGGIIPLYLVIKQFGLVNSIFSVVLTYGINTFYMIIMMNYFSTLPDSLMESARLDGAGEWRILLRIVLPLSAPIIATITLFYAVDRWNEWYHSMIFIRKADITPLQIVLRNIVLEAQNVDIQAGMDMDEIQQSPMGLKMCAVMVTMLPVMCIFPFLQKHFVKGVLVGAIK